MSCDICKYLGVCEDLQVSEGFRECPRYLRVSAGTNIVFENIQGCPRISGGF